MPSRRATSKSSRTGPVRASIYVRMSLDKSGEGLGVERQEQQCRELCQAHGWEVAEVFKDNDVSATTGRRRPGFEALLASSPEVVVVWHIDRLLRVSRDLDRVIDLEVNIYAVTSDGPMDLSSPTGRMHARMSTVISTYEGEHKAERQRASARQRAEAGKSWWPTRPFGFELDGTHRADEAAALVKAYGDVLTGVSLRSVARHLTEAGHRTNAGNPWTATTFRPVLLNARNAGIRVYDGEEVGAAAWEGIVSEDVWRATVRLLTDPSRRTGGGGAEPRNLLTGIATCGKCGSTVKVGWRNGRAGEQGAYSVYVCRTSSCVSFPVVELDAAVSARLAHELDSPATRDQWQGLRKREGESVKALRVDEATVRSRLDGLAEDYADGIIDRAQFQTGSMKLRARLTEIEESIDQAARSADVATTVTLGDQVMETFLAQDPSTPAEHRPPLNVDEFRKLITAVFERVELLPRGRGVRVLHPDHLNFVPRSIGASA